MADKTKVHDNFVVRKLLDIQSQGTTSHNGRNEILHAFGEVAKWREASNTCSFYQGCGQDLINLACVAIDTHVLSDEHERCADLIAEKLGQLADSNLITDLRGSEGRWRFSFGGRAKHVVFSTKPIDQIDFRSHVGVPLGVVFEWNCGDSALKKSFWDAISNQMVVGGHVIGSFATDMATCGRSAFVLSDIHGKPVLEGYDGWNDVDNGLRRQILAKAEEMDLQPLAPGSRRVIEVGSDCCLCFGSSGNEQSVTRMWREPVTAFGLALTRMGDRICHLTRNERG